MKYWQALWFIGHAMFYAVAALVNWQYGIAAAFFAFCGVLFLRTG